MVDINNHPGHPAYSRIGPTSSCMLATKFPSMVERRWPTWKGLAMFGELNSTTIFLLSSSNKALLLHFFWLCDLQRQALSQCSALHTPNLPWVVVKTSDINEGEFSLKKKNSNDSPEWYYFDLLKIDHGWVRREWNCFNAILSNSEWKFLHYAISVT